MIPQLSLWGCGYWGKNWARCLAAQGALHSICEPDAARQQQLKEQYPSTPIYSEPSRLAQVAAHPAQAVVIATPAISHFQLASMALDMGLDVCVEKPLAMTPTQGEALVAKASQQQRLLMVGHVLEYHPAFLCLEQALLDGQIGQLQYIYTHRLNLGKFRREEDVLLSFAPHDIGLILRLARTAPLEIHCHGAAYLQAKHADLTTTHLRFANNVQAHVFVSWLHPFKEQRFIVIGSQGMMVWDDVQKQLQWYKTILPADLTALKAGSGQLLPFAAHEPLAQQCSHFLHCIGSREQPRTHGQRGLEVLQVLHAAQQQLYPMA